MLGRIGNSLGCLMLNALRGAAVPVRCAQCGHQFKPFEGHRFTRFGEIMERFPCPRCGHQFGIGEDAKSKRDQSAFNPPGPFSKPPASKIERSEPSAETVLFFLPPTGRAGILLVMGIFWSACMLPLFFVAFFRGHFLDHVPTLGPKIFIGVFTAVGLGLLYGALRQKYSTLLVYLSPDLVRVQRKLLLRSAQDLRPEEVKSVRLVEFYTENSTAVHGIEIGAGLRLIRFGSSLPDDEKRWLAWEIRDYLRRHGATELPEEGA